MPLSPLFPYWLGKVKADILHFHLPNPTAVISYLMRRPKGKVVVHWHSDIIRQKDFLLFYKPFLYSFLKSADSIIGTSERYIETSPHLAKFLDKCVAIPLGIDTESFESNLNVDDEVVKIRERYGERIVLFVGLLRYYKGVQYLVNAMKKVDGKLLIIGKGPMEEKLKSITQNSNLEEKVIFIGSIDDREKLNYLHACDVFCLPSIFRSEGFGLSQLEAFACEKPVISTNLNTGVPYVNQHEKTGIIVEPRDTIALSNAINKLLHDEGLRLKYGKSAKERALSEFSPEIVLKKTRDVYDNLIR